MNERIANLWASLSGTIEGRSSRERWLLLVVAAVVTLMSVQSLFVAPLRGRAEDARARVSRLEEGLLRAAQLGPELQSLQAEIGLVEKRIQTANQTDLFLLLENLAEATQMKQQLESIKPKTASDNDIYPETRVEVQLRGATLAQTVQFLYRIETAPLYLIVRSISFKTRRDDSQLLDVNFSVSSFTRSDQRAAGAGSRPERGS